MSLLPVCLRLFYALGYSTRHSLDRALCALGQVIDRVRRHWYLLGSRISGEGTHEPEHAHDAANEKQWYPGEAAPKQTWRAVTAKGRKETDHADDEENETHRGDERARDPQEGARRFVFFSL